MSKASYRRLNRGSTSGRFVVSEGVAPSAYLYAHPGLPTFYNWGSYGGDDRFEVVIPQGTILSVVTGADSNAYIVPANGSAAAFVWTDAQVPPVEVATPPIASGTPAGVDSISVPAKSVPIGCAQADVFRPFDRNASFAASWISQAYVEWPLVQGLNDTIAIGDVVVADAIGRPVKAAAPGTDSHLNVGKVVEIEKFATNFNDGLLSYMQLPSDPGALKSVYSITRPGPYKDKFGVRKNLDVTNSVGAMRVLLTLT